MPFASHVIDLVLFTVFFLFRYHNYFQKHSSIFVTGYVRITIPHADHKMISRGDEKPFKVLHAYFNLI